MQEMANLGFIEVYNMVGGIEEWEAAGFPVTMDQTLPTTIPPTTTPNEPLECGILVRGIILPAAAPHDMAEFSIGLVITNVTDQSVDCTIPITVVYENDQDLAAEYELGVTVEAGKTELVSYGEAELPASIYTVYAGGVSQTLMVITGGG